MPYRSQILDTKVILGSSTVEQSSNGGGPSFPAPFVSDARLCASGCMTKGWRCGRRLPAGKKFPAAGYLAARRWGRVTAEHCARRYGVTALRRCSVAALRHGETARSLRALLHGGWHSRFIEHMSGYRTVEQSQLFSPKNERVRVRCRYCFGTDYVRGARCSSPASSSLWLPTEVRSVVLLLALLTPRATGAESRTQGPSRGQE